VNLFKFLGKNSTDFRCSVPFGADNEEVFVFVAVACAALTH